MAVAANAFRKGHKFKRGGIKSSFLVRGSNALRKLSELPFYGSLNQMPWTPNDAQRHTHEATSWELKELWAKVANECLERTGEAAALSGRRTLWSHDRWKPASEA